MKKADLVLKSNAVFTGLTSSAFKGGIAISGNIIVAVGNDMKIDGWVGTETKVLEYCDEMIMPGFIDAHMHFFTGAFVSSEYMLMELFEAHSEEECANMVENFASKHPEYKTITGMGWFPVYWDKSDILPHRSSLDAVVQDRPVYLLSADGHTFWLNSKALEECNITKNTKVTFGEIGKDENGELTGLLFEIEAESPANERAFLLPRDELKTVQKNFYKEVARWGITSATNMSVCPVMEESFKEYEIAAELEKDGELTVRLHLYPSLGLHTNLDKAITLREQYCSDKLRVSGLKQFVDGVTSTYSAYLLEPYTDKPETRGFSNYSAEFYKECIVNANKEGFGVRLHAIGDAAVKLALDAYEESNKQNDNKNIKNCIEHIESIHPDDIPRFAKLGIIASMQPTHLIHEVNEKVSRIGVERCKYEWPFKTLLDKGAILAFGTDFPVANFNPFLTIYSAVTRSTEEGELIGVNPQEKLSLAEALRTYTYGGACSINRESQLGTLVEGKLADIIVLNKNLFSVPSNEILNTRVKLAIMDGKVVFEG